ncbi:MAG: hypothetical protein ACRDOK_16165 [Streptosporangiaceae bacterium]
MTAVEDSEGAYRRSVHTSAYPLAEWIAFNWWFLKDELRPSALPVAVWTWSNALSYDWLHRHNTRGAGNGMPWPDLTLVAEGGVTRAVWHTGSGLAGQPISFLGNGDVYLQSTQLLGELTRFVDHVINRLREANVDDTPLAKEWHALRETDDEEAAFASAAARLGLDPYSMAINAQENLVAISEEIDNQLMEEFLDSASPDDLMAAYNWLGLARNRAANLGAEGIKASSGDLTSIFETSHADVEDKPWQRGYSAAREVRRLLGSEPTRRLDIDSLVSEVRVVGRSGGLEGFTQIDSANRAVLVLPAGRRLQTAVRFVQARSLGLLLSSGRREHLLDPVSTDLTKESRAFAAELLAPAAGVAEYLSSLPTVTDAAFDAVAAHFKTTTLVIRHQYENQVVASA